MKKIQICKFSKTSSFVNHCGHLWSFYWVVNLFYLAGFEKLELNHSLKNEHNFSHTVWMSCEPGTKWAKQKIDFFFNYFIFVKLLRDRAEGSFIFASNFHRFLNEEGHSEESHFSIWGVPHPALAASARECDRFPAVRACVHLQG